MKNPDDLTIRLCPFLLFKEKTVEQSLFWWGSTRSKQTFRCRAIGFSSNV